MCFTFRYYRSDKDVKEDTEVQSFANEVSDEGTMSGGARVQVNPFLGGGDVFNPLHKACMFPHS